MGIPAADIYTYTVDIQVFWKHDMDLSEEEKNIWSHYTVALKITFAFNSDMGIGMDHSSENVFVFAIRRITPSLRNNYVWCHWHHDISIASWHNILSFVVRSFCMASEDLWYPNKWQISCMDHFYCILLQSSFICIV